MPCEDCLNRRDFLARSALAAAALVVAEGCGDGQIGPVIPHRTGGGDPNLPISPSVTINVKDFPLLAVTGTICADGALGAERALVRTTATTFQGISRICTHQQCLVDVNGNRFVCPCHGSTFSNDGSVINGPNIESPPITPLRTLATTFDAATNTVTVA